MIARPPRRWMAPSTPPPPISEEFAALTIESTRCVVMSPCSSSIRAIARESYRWTWAASSGESGVVKIVVTGSSGFIGTALVRALERRGHRVIRLVRGGAAGEDRVVWDPENGRLDADALAGSDAAVNLAGEPIGARRWTERQKARIIDSRERTTTLLSHAMAQLSPRPRSLLSA